LCEDIYIDSSQLRDLTTCVIGQFDSQPVSTDQFVKYLKVVELEEDHIDTLIEFIIDKRRALYSWQNYLLWQLFVLKNIFNPTLLSYAQSVVENKDSCEADKSGAALYIGRVGSEAKKKEVLSKFKDCKSYLQKRNMLIGLHEVRYTSEVSAQLAPYMIDDLEGVYRGLKSKKYKGVYCKKPDPVNYKRIYDEVCQYEYI
jgi:hypothetical protein